MAVPEAFSVVRVGDQGEKAVANVTPVSLFVTVDEKALARNWLFASA